MKKTQKDEKLWKKIRLEYESTETSYAKLSNKYGWSKNGIAKRSKREGWKKFKHVKKEIENKAKDQFILESAIGVQELMKIEDETLERLQKVVDGEVPYQEIFRNVENLRGDLIVKIDGTIKGITETAMLIGNKRRELRGVLPLKDRELIAIKREELKFKKEQSNKENEAEGKTKNIAEIRKKFGL